MIESFRRFVVVLGCGGWGIVFVVYFVNVGCLVRFWGCDEVFVCGFVENRLNLVYLFDVVLLELVNLMWLIGLVVSYVYYVVVVVLLYGVWDFMWKVVGYIEIGVMIVSVVKGIEEIMFLCML